MRNLKSAPRLSKLSRLLKRNFPDFYAEARFQIGDDELYETALGILALGELEKGAFRPTRVFNFG